MEWVSVKDRMPPKKKGEILTFSMIKTLEGEMVPCISMDPRNCLYIRKGRLYSDFDTAEITHWMPLPEPPELSSE